MRVRPTVFDDSAHLGEAAADFVIERIEHTDNPFLLGCPGGRSALSTYRALARAVAHRNLDLSQLTIVMMDDYLIEDESGLRRESPQAAHSCERFAREDIVGLINEGLTPTHRIPQDLVWLPDPADPASYDARIEEAGGIDLFLLASGASNGHIAFNSPGSPRESGTRVVPLPDSTRRDNLATFPSFGNDIDNVPRYGVTVGIDTIASHSKSVLLLVHGPDKKEAVSRITAADAYTPAWPATIVTECRDPHFFADRVAAAALQAEYI